MEGRSCSADRFSFVYLNFHICVFVFAYVYLCICIWRYAPVCLDSSTWCGVARFPGSFIATQARKDQGKRYTHPQLGVSVQPGTCVI